VGFLRCSFFVVTPGRGKATLIADAIRIRNALYSRNVDTATMLIQKVGHEQGSIQLQREHVVETVQENLEASDMAPLPSKKEHHTTSGTNQSDNGFWNGMDNTLDMFSI